MPGTLIATTSMRDYQPLGTGGQRTIDAAEAILALLARALTPAHAALFAEPQPNSERGTVDWYAEGTGPTAILSDLPPDRAAPVRAELDRLTDDIRGLVARLREAPQESDRFLAEMLDRALHYPDATAVRVRNGRPVLVAWGHQRLGPTAEPPAVLGRVRQAPRPMAILPPPPSPIAVGPRLWPWLASLGVALVLLIGAFWLLAHPPAVAGPAICRIQDGDLEALAAWREADAQNATLRLQLAALVDEAGRRRLQCNPVNRAGVTPPHDQASAPNDQARARQRGAHAGKLEVILAWDNRSDLDLHVLCPDNEHLYFHNSHACGGVLDVDANADANQATDTPVENAFWNDPPPGTYKVVVDPYEMRGRTTSQFRVTVREEGQPDRVQEGTAIAGQRVKEVLEFQVPPP